MFAPSRTQIRCPNCGQPFVGAVEQIIDGGRDPQAKARLLSGRTNTAACPGCRYEFRLAAPVLYHDGNKELLAVHVPMELGLPQIEQDRLVGQMMNAITNSLPQEQRKGYLLVPKTALTMNGLVEMVLEADGITREMLEARRAKLRVAENMLRSDPNTWDDMIRQHDADIDEDLIAMVLASADAAMANGRPEVAEAMIALRERMIAISTAGQGLLAEAQFQEALVQSVTNDLNAMGETPDRRAFIDLAVRYAREDGDNDTRMQVLVGLLRPAMDYQFFMELTSLIEDASGDERALLESVRDTLTTLTQAVDQQSESVLRQAADLLQDIVNADDLETAIGEHINQIDDTFMAVLTTNLQAAERQNNQAAIARLREVYDRIMEMIQESSPPPLRFINELLSMGSPDEARDAIKARISEFGPELAQIMDVLIQELGSRGANPTLDRLNLLRRMVDEALNGSSGAAKAAPAPTGPRLVAPPEEPPAQEKGSGLVIPFSRSKSRKKD